MAIDFGSDFAGTNAYDFDLSREVTGVDLLNQAIVIRLSNPRGSFIDAPDECLDLRELINEGMTSAQLSQLGSRIRAEVQRDNRVDTCNVSVTSTNTNGQVSLTIEISGESELGPFDLVLSADAVTVELLNGDVQ